jgi:glycosyltransferase involved in cell wall biosynthesis
VVVAAYQAERTLEECLDSLTHLDYPGEDLEIVCVDNGSTDATAAIARRFAPGIVTLTELERGAASARNRGIAAAHGEVVAFTDADCTVSPTWLRHLVGPLADPRVGIAGGCILAKQPCNWIERFGERIHDHAVAIEATEPPYAISMNWASRRAVLQHYGGFDARLLRCQDVDLSFRMLRDGMTIDYVADAVVYHRNERTLLGLFREGYVHGYNGRAVVELHREYLETFPPSYTSLQRMIEAIRTFRRTWSVRDTLLQFLFDLGKVWGAARAGSDKREG